MTRRNRRILRWSVIVKPLVPPAASAYERGVAVSLVSSCAITRRRSTRASSRTTC